MVFECVNVILQLNDRIGLRNLDCNGVQVI
jgi:hypothetical protein